MDYYRTPKPTKTRTVCAVPASSSSPSTLQQQSGKPDDKPTRPVGKTIDELPPETVTIGAERFFHLQEDMAGVPLLQENTNKNNRSVRSSISRFTSFLSSAIAGKDDLTVACEKAASTHTASYSPKEKHVEFIIEQVDENPLLIEEVLLRFSALTNWAEDAVVAIKILSTIHQIVRRVPNCLVVRSDSFVVFLDEIRNHWSAQQVVFVDQYSAALMHLVLTARQHYQLYENTFSRGIGISLGISFFQGEEISVYVSKLLSFQERLLGIVRIPSFPTNSTQRNPALARRASCTVIIDQCKQLLSVICYLIMHLEGLRDQESIDTSIFREQMDAQDKFLQSIEREFA